jgi:predicted nucleic acid-binding protein
VLKLATIPRENSPSALIVEIVLRDLAEMWASPAMLEEYAEVLADEPEFLAELTGRVRLVYPLAVLDVIRHEPDNRFVECALALPADFIITVNTARGHFDRKAYDRVRVATPGAWVNLPEARSLIAQI